MALPRVLKRGVEIGRHTDHKGRDYGTITFAAPVTINGKTGNMAVVVNRHGDHYSVHRLVLPDGSEFKFAEQNKDAAQEPSRGGVDSDSLAKTTSATSNASVTDKSETVKREYSLHGARDLEHHVADLQKQNARLQAWESALRESRGKTVETGERQYAFKDKKIPTYDELVAKPDLKVVDIRGAGGEELSFKGFKTSEEARALAKEPVVNKDTGETVFITAKTFSHSFSGVGANKVMAARNIREIVENAVLTHAEPSRNARSSEMGVYTLFGAVLTESGVQPVKVKIKEYSIDGRDIPENVREVLGAAAEGNFASVYDNRVLVVEGIEKEGSDGSVLAAAPENGVADRYPSVPSKISIKDLMGLVNSEYQKYLPQKMLSGADRKDYSLRGARDLEHQVADLQKQNARLQAWESALRESRGKTVGSAERQYKIDDKKPRPSKRTGAQLTVSQNTKGKFCQKIVRCITMSFSHPFRI